MARPASLVMAIVWLGVIGVGMGALVRYEKTPAAATPHPAEWPEDSRLTRDPHGPTLLMFAHPRCPCTRASLDELTRLVHDNDARATVVFYQPEDDDSAEWTETALVRTVHDQARIALAFDPGGVESDRFGATASGCCVLYDQAGRLTFSGGVTAGRGHAGPSESQRLLAERLNDATAETASCPSYGCSLRASEAGR